MTMKEAAIKQMVKRHEEGREEKGIGYNIMAWYVSEYPSDDLGGVINPAATFIDLFEALDNYSDVYAVFGVRDSVIRERAFSKLAELIEVDYEYIYEQWLRA